MQVSQTKVVSVNGNRWHVPEEYVAETSDSWLPWETNEERAELVKLFENCLRHKMSLISVNGFQDEHVYAERYAQTSILYRECYGLDNAVKRGEDQLRRAGDICNEIAKECIKGTEIPEWKMRKADRDHEQAHYNLAMVCVQQDAARNVFKDVTGNEWRPYAKPGESPQQQQQSATTTEFMAKYGGYSETL